MPDQYQRDREVLERLQAALALRGITAEIVVPDLQRPYPALNVYHPERTYAIDSVWFYDQGDQLPGRHHHGTSTPIGVYVWGGSFQHTADARQVDAAAERIAAAWRAIGN
jgi:hypothetical protein